MLRRVTRSGRSIDADAKDLDYEDPTEKKSSKSQKTNNSKVPSFKSGKEEIKNDKMLHDLASQTASELSEEESKNQEEEEVIIENSK